MNIAQVIMYLFPQADPLSDFLIQDDSDGKGPYIAQWNLEADKPTEEALQAAWDAMQPTEADLLDAEKAKKMAEIQSAVSIALQTFTSDTLGTVHTYLSGITDMLLLESEDRFMQSMDWDQKDILWYTIENGDTDHTKDQIHKLYLDGRAAVQRKKYTARDLAAQVMAAEDSAAVNAIDVQSANWA